MWKFVISSSVVLIYLCLISAKPDAGFCRSYKWGGTSGLHFFACCNNSDEGSRAYCNKKTYQTASSASYCGPWGAKTTKGTTQYDYTCGGCSGQNTIERACKKKKLVINMKGFCWTYTRCMHKKCKAQYSGKKKQVSTGQTTGSDCGNGVCEPGETRDNCDMDCCGKVNPVCDMDQYIKSGKCPPPCCGERECCLSVSSAEESKSCSGINFFIMGLFLNVFGLL